MANSNDSKTVQDYIDEYSSRMDSKTDQEIINMFNNQVNNPAWVTARQGYLIALHQQLVKRNIDYSSVGTEKSLSFAHKVFLKDKTISVLV